jgi:hypothetical protein
MDFVGIMLAFFLGLMSAVYATVLAGLAGTGAFVLVFGMIGLVLRRAHPVWTACAGTINLMVVLAVMLLAGLVPAYLGV